MHAQPHTLTLTRDELLAILNIMGCSTMSGLDAEPLAGLSEIEVATHLNAGVETLFNRGLLTTQNEDTLVLNDLLVALVGASVIPEATLLITSTQPDGTNDPHYFSATPHLFVEHASPRPGIHVFTHIPDIQVLSSRVETLIADLSLIPSSEARAFPALPDTILTSAVQALRAHDYPTAAHMLREAGWSPDTAELFTSDCSQATFWTGLAVWGLRQQAPEGNATVMVIAGAQYAWFVDFMTDQSEMALIRTIDGDTCRQHFLALLDSLKLAMPLASSLQ